MELGKLALKRLGTVSKVSEQVRRGPGLECRCVLRARGRPTLPVSSQPVCVKPHADSDFMYFPPTRPSLTLLQAHCQPELSRVI